jgi:parallel beta-helix repeat protein
LLIPRISLCPGESGYLVHRRYAISQLAIAMLVCLIMTLSAIPAEAYSGASEDVMKEPDHGLGGQAGVGASIGSYPPLRIDGDVELAAMAVAQGWPGAGTVGDPFIIESLRFIAPKSEIAVYIGNTSSYLVLSNLTIFMAPNYGILLHNVRNAVVENSTITSGAEAITLEDSQDYVVCDNIIKECWYGISLTSSPNGSVIRNVLSNVYLGGITLTSCHDVSADSNRINNYSDAIALYSSTAISLQGNVIADCWHGIKLYTSDHNAIVDNQLERSNLYTYESNGNVVYRNLLLGDETGGSKSTMDITSSDSNLFRENLVNNSDVFLESFSNRNIFIGNTIRNSNYGISVRVSTENVFWSNTFTNASIDLGESDDFKNTYQTITTNNTVNGRPIYYYKNSNMDNATVPLDAGEVLVDNVSYLVIQDLSLGNQPVGLQVHYSDHITVRGNTIISTGYNEGIRLHRTNESQVWDNTLISAELVLSGSNNNSIRNNHVSNGTGIWLHASIDSVLEGNVLVNASVSLSSGLLLFSDPLADLMYSRNSISTNNTVNGGPVYFYKYADMAGMSVPADAGQVLLAYVDNLHVHDLDLSQQFSSLSAWHCLNLHIENNTFEDVSGTAVSLDYCGNSQIRINSFEDCSGSINIRGSYNVISNNTARNTHPLMYEGNSLSILGSYNLISYNIFSGGKYGNTGIVGSHNRIEHNSINDARTGLDIGGDTNLGSGQNRIIANEISNCSIAGISIEASDDNLLQSNQLSSCGIGISIHGSENPGKTSSHNSLYANTLTGCSLDLSYGITTMTSQTIAPNNTVNGKPVYYYSNVDMGDAQVPLDAGQVILANVTHLRVHGLRLVDQSTGLTVTYSSSISVRDCAFLNDSIAGIQVYQSPGCIIEENELRTCTIGIEMRSDDCFASHNVISESLFGIRLLGSRNHIEYNLIERSGGLSLEAGSGNFVQHNLLNDSLECGIHIYYSSQNIISDNIIRDSISYGIWLEDSSDNQIYRNMLIGNNGCGPAYDPMHAQARDSLISSWNSSLGNYWSDRTGPDLNRDGIVDVPYPIAGNGLSSDELPLASPVGVPYGLGANLNAGSAELSWTGVNYSLPGPIEGFTLYRYSPQEGSASFDLAPSARSYSDASVQPSYTYSYHLTARSGGYQSGPSPSVNVVVPGQHPGPIVNITSPQDQSITNQTSVEVHWTGSDPGSISYYWIRLDSASWQNATTSSSWTFHGLGNGPHSVVVKAFNQTGGNGSDSASFTVDTLAPSIVISAPLESSFINASAIFLSWTAADAGSGVLGCRYRVDGGSWSSMTSSSTALLSALSEGGHRVEVQAFDRANNPAIAAVNLTIDTVLPSLSIISPSNGALFNLSSQEVAWTANGTGSPLSTVRTRADEGAWTLWPASTQHVSFTSLAEGEHELSVKVTDLAGNVREASVHLTVDTISPQVVAHGPSGSSVAPSSTLSVSFSEAMDQGSVSLTVPGMAGSLGWSANQLTFTPSSDLVPGTQYTATVSGNDLAGNPVQYQWSFTVAQPSPAPGYDWLWLLILLILLIIIVIAVYEWRRRKRKAQK